MRHVSVLVVAKEGLMLLVALMEKHVSLNSMQSWEVMSMLASSLASSAVAILALHALHAIMLSVCNTPPNRREHKHEACNGQLQLALIAGLHYVLPTHFPSVSSDMYSMSHTS